LRPTSHTGHFQVRMSGDLSPIIERFQAIAKDVLSATDLNVDPWCYRYCGSLGDPSGANRYVRLHADLLALAETDDRDRVVVDAGCGFGFTMVLHALFGARQVRGVELNADMVSCVEAYVPLLPADVSSRIEVFNGSVSEMPYDDASADIMLSIEAISHYLDVDAFIDEAFRVLRPDGVLIIADGNNGSNPLVRRKTYEIWEAVERGPAGQTVHGHVLGTPYVEVRRELLYEHFPSISDATRAQIAQRTAGFTREQLFVAAQNHLDTGAVPAAAYKPRQLAVAPDGTAMERLFAPGKLAQRLNRRGFVASAYGYWGGANGSSLVRSANRALSALSPVTMPTARAFRVIARKPAAGHG
jgi:SAM-dependent methyltransferase